MNDFAKCILSILFSFAFFVNLLVVTVQHVGVTSASEVHKYPADIGKYIVSFITEAFGCLLLCFYATLLTANFA